MNKQTQILIYLCIVLFYFFPIAFLLSVYVQQGLVKNHAIQVVMIGLWACSSCAIFIVLLKIRESEFQNRLKQSHHQEDVFDSLKEIPKKSDLDRIVEEQQRILKHSQPTYSELAAHFQELQQKIDTYQSQSEEKIKILLHISASQKKKIQELATAVVVPAKQIEHSEEFPIIQSGDTALKSHLEEERQQNLIQQKQLLEAQAKISHQEEIIKELEQKIYDLKYEIKTLIGLKSD